MARANFENDIECSTATSASAQDPQYVCTGTCRELIDAIIENCDPSVS